VKRLLWIGVGIAVGAIVVRQVTKAARAYSPAGLTGSARNSAAGLVDSVRDFVADVREGMAIREAEIHAAFARGESLADFDDDDDLGDDYGFADEDGVGVRR
jgi:hypothetical protein